jgi:type IV secretion system protein VirB2
MKINNKLWSMVLLAVVMAVLLVPELAFAKDAGSGGEALPWNGAFDKLSASLTGTTAKVISTIVIAATGLMLAFGEAGSASRKSLQIVFGISLAFGAATFIGCDQT